jgi:hypothetical protein
MPACAKPSAERPDGSNLLNGMKSRLLLQLPLLSFYTYDKYLSNAMSKYLQKILIYLQKFLFSHSQPGCRLFISCQNQTRF